MITNDHLKEMIEMCDYRIERHQDFAPLMTLSKFKELVEELLKRREYATERNERNAP